MPKTKSPTEEAYGQLQTAYAHFNKRLFGGRLPGCLFTFQRQANTYGYFSGQRWDRHGEAMTDEIAINPGYLKVRPIMDILSTLAHEMVHQEQDHFGKPSRRSYHNKEWARMMKAIGLQSSHTGEAGGKEVGERMTHYVSPGGRFEKACQELVKGGFSFAWTDRSPVHESGGAAGEPEPRPKNKIKYTCPGCKLNVWGKPELHVACLACELELAAVQ